MIGRTSSLTFHLEYHQLNACITRIDLRYCLYPNWNFLILLKFLDRGSRLDFKIMTRSWAFDQKIVQTQLLFVGV